MIKKAGLFAAAAYLCLAVSSLAQDFPQEPAARPLLEEGNRSTISLDIKGMDVVDVLKMLASRAQLNIVVGKDVTGRVTLFLKDADIWDAFEIILAASDLAYEKRGGIVNVMTQREYELLYGQRYRQKTEVRIVPLRYAKAADVSRSLSQMKSNVGRVVVNEGTNTLILIDTPDKLEEMTALATKADPPLKTQVFSLSYAQAEKLNTKLQDLVTKDVGTIKLDERTNKLAVTDYPDKLAQISEIINAFDEKTRQVLIDAQVIEVKPSDKLEMGVDWQYWIKKHFNITSALPIGTANRLLLGTTSVAPSSAGDYKAVIDLLRSIGDVKILSSPRITALNNQEAKILVGTKQPYASQTTVTGDGGTVTTAENITFVDVGIKLYVTPTINSDDFVTMKIRPEISSTGTPYKTAKGEEVPVVSTSEAETSVMVKDGVTIIIGGLTKDERSKTVKKIPGLGDIPLLGFLFRSTSDEVKKTDLVILLTPHLLSGEKALIDKQLLPPRDGAIVRMVDGEVVAQQFHSGIPEPMRSPRMSVAEYAKQLNRTINQSAALLRLPQGEKGTVSLTFRLSYDGRLIGEPVVVAASDPLIIPYAFGAIREAAPFPGFPDALARPEETFSVVIDYK